MNAEQFSSNSPHPMPIDHEQWLSELHLCNFVNAYYQYRDLRALGGGKSLLMVGPGQGIETAILRWQGFQVTTFDIDDKFQPDVVGSVHDLGMFQAESFDAVVASHVLEHLPVTYLDQALAEIARVGRFALVYLPVHGRHLQFRLKPGFGDIDKSAIIDLFNYMKNPTGLQPDYMAGQHYWEVGMRGFRLHNLIGRFVRWFEVLQHYRNKDWSASHNFVLKSRHAGQNRGTL